MIKTFCNKCGKELSSGNYRNVRISISPIACHGEVRLEYCESCFKEIIGEEEYNAMIQREAEYKRSIEERKRSETMTLDELKTEISERIESEQDKLDSLNNRKSRKDRNYYISEGMLIAFQIVSDYFDDLEVIT